MERPPHSVAPMDLFALLPPERWYAEALDFLTCAAHLFTAMTEGTLRETWPRAKAAGFLYAHGIELFLKAAIAQAEQPMPKTHNLKALKSRFDSLYPGAAISIPGDNTAEDPSERTQSPRNQFYREIRPAIPSEWKIALPSVEPPS